jgi:hypothetical protein
MYKDQINKIRYLNYNINMLNDDNKNTRKVNKSYWIPNQVYIYRI